MLGIDEERGRTCSDGTRGFPHRYDAGVSEEKVEKGEAGEKDVVQLCEGERVGKGVVLVHSAENLKSVQVGDRLTSHCWTQDCAHAARSGSPFEAFAVIGRNKNNFAYCSAQSRAVLTASAFIKNQSSEQQGMP